MVRIRSPCVWDCKYYLNIHSFGIFHSSPLPVRVSDWDLRFFFNTSVLLDVGSCIKSVVHHYPRNGSDPGSSLESHPFYGVSTGIAYRLSHHLKHM